MLCGAGQPPWLCGAGLCALAASGLSVSCLRRGYYCHYHGRRVNTGAAARWRGDRGRRPTDAAVWRRARPEARSRYDRSWERHVILITVSPGTDENASASGDFDLPATFTINGNGAASTHHRRRQRRPRSSTSPSFGPQSRSHYLGCDHPERQGLSPAAFDNVGGSMYR